MVTPAELAAGMAEVGCKKPGSPPTTVFGTSSHANGASDTERVVRRGGGRVRGRVQAAGALLRIRPRQATGSATGHPPGGLAKPEWVSGHVFDSDMGLSRRP